MKITKVDRPIGKPLNELQESLLETLSGGAVEIAVEEGKLNSLQTGLRAWAKKRALKLHYRSSSKGVILWVEASLEEPQAPPASV